MSPKLLLVPFLWLLILSPAQAKTENLSDIPIETLWDLSNSTAELVEVEGEKVIRWTPIPGQAATLAMKKDHPLFSRLRYYDRLEFDFRIATGQADYVEFRALGHVSGARQFKIYQWQVGILTTPVGPWYARQLDFQRPNWFPWDDPDGSFPQFQFGSLAVAPDTVIEIRNLRLISNPLIIKPFFEYPITWPVLTRGEDGGAIYEMEVCVLNTAGVPTKIHGKIVSKHEHFDVALASSVQEVTNGKVATFKVTAKMSPKAIAATPLLFSEPVQIAFHTDVEPETFSTFELPVTRPLDAGLTKQFIVPQEDIAFVREKIAANDQAARKALNLDYIFKEADAFLPIELLHIPMGRTVRLINFWPTVRGTKQRYQIGSAMPEVINPVTGKREVGTHMAARVWKEYLGNTGKLPENLGLAYLFSGDEKYAAKAVELFETWAAYYHEIPWTTHSSWEPGWNEGPAFLASSRIAEASSYGSNWYFRFQMRLLGMIADSPSFTPEARAKVYRDFVLPYATEIAKFPGGISNMTDITNHNLLVMGLVFDDANLVRWALLSDPGLLRRLGDLDEDGFSSEGRPLNYHVAAMQEYLPTIGYLKNSGIKLDIPMDRLLRAVRMPYTRPTLFGVVPSSGDCGRGGAIGQSVLADDLVPLFPKESWLLDIGRGSSLSAKVARLKANFDPKAKANAYTELFETTPRLFGNAGLAILRSGESADEQIMATLDYGRNPMHGHLDRNQITLAAFGKVFTHGTGTLYNAGGGPIIKDFESPYAPFCGKNSIGQNVVVVDTVNQLPAIGNLVAWSPKEGNQFATATVKEINPGVDHTRTLVLRDGYVLVVDRMQAQEERQFDFAYHNFGTLTPGNGWQSQPEKTPLGTTAGYRDLQDLARLSGSGPVHLLWDLTQQVSAVAKTPPPTSPVHLALWQIAPQGAEFFTATTGMNNPNTMRIPDAAPSLFSRAKGKEAVYVTVLEPYKEAATITAVSGDAKTLTLTRNGKAEVIDLASYLKPAPAGK